MNEPTLERIIEARNRCAEIIAKYGDRYLPIFERLENEIATQKEKQKLLNKAILLGSKNSTHNSTQNGTQLTNAFNLTNQNFK